MNSDLVSLIAGNENKIVKLQRVVGGEAPMTTNLDMRGYRKEIQVKRKTLKVTSLQPKLFTIIWPKLTKITREDIEMVHLMKD